MAWVRYDDQFHNNAKVTAVIAEDPAALSMHLVANTWTNGQKRKGFVPVHQPGVLICDRNLGAAWAELLVKHGLWHTRTGVANCAACREEYADLPAELDGFVIHNAQEYRAPARERSTPGTPEDLSQKRREAGRRGGRVSAARRAEKAQVSQASQANGVSKTSKQGEQSTICSSKSVSPVPVPVPVVAPNGATIPPTAGAATAQTLVAEWIDHVPKKPPSNVIGQVSRNLKSMLDEGLDPADVRRGLAEWARKGLHPSTLPSVVNEVMNARPLRSVNGTRSTTDDRVAAAQALKAKFRAIPGEVTP